MNKKLPDGFKDGNSKYGNSRPIARDSRPILRSTAFQEIPVDIEIDAGSFVMGNGWSKRYTVPYGEIPGSATLADGDPVDVYLGPNQNSDSVYVVHQNKRDGTYDEDKVLLGFADERTALKCYFEHGPEWGFGSIDTMTVEEFKKGYLASNRVEMVNKGEGD